MLRIKLLSLGLLCLLSLASSAQKSDQRLVDVFGKKHIKTLKKTDAKQLEVMTYALDNGYHVWDIPQQKVDNGSLKLETVAVADMNNINIFALGIKLDPQRRTYLQIEGTDKMLVVLTSKEIEAKLEKND